MACAAQACQNGDEEDELCTSRCAVAHACCVVRKLLLAHSTECYGSRTRVWCALCTVLHAKPSTPTTPPRPVCSSHRAAGVSRVACRKNFNTRTYRYLCIRSMLKISAACATAHQLVQCSSSLQSCCSHACAARATQHWAPGWLYQTILRKPYACTWTGRATLAIVRNTYTCSVGEAPPNGGITKATPYAVASLGCAQNHIP